MVIVTFRGSMHPCRNLNPKTSLACQTMASPSTDCLHYHVQNCRLWNCFCLYTHKIVTLKCLSGKTTPKTNLTSLPGLDVCAGEQLVSWGLSYQVGPYLELVPHNLMWFSYQHFHTSTLPHFHTSTLPAIPAYTTIVGSVPPQKVCLDLFEHTRAFSRTVSAVSLLQLHKDARDQNKK